jgi:hypothetical protein
MLVERYSALLDANVLDPPFPRGAWRRKPTFISYPLRKLLVHALFLN